VTVITAQQIQRSGLTTLSDVVRAVSAELFLDISGEGHLINREIEGHQGQ
jgi:hypothetical protein